MSVKEKIEKIYQNQESNDSGFSEKSSEKRFSFLLTQLIDFCDTYSVSRAELLDFGCGPGNLIEFLQNHLSLPYKCSYSGYDIRSSMIDLAESIYSDSSLVDLQFFTEEECIDESYDLICAFGVFYHKLDEDIVKSKEICISQIENICSTFDFNRFIFSLRKEEFSPKEEQNPEIVKNLVSFSGKEVRSICNTLSIKYNVDPIVYDDIVDSERIIILTI